MIEEIGTFAGAFRTVTGLLLNLRKLGQDAESRGVPEDFAAEFNSKIIEMQETVMAAQSQALEAQATQSALTDKVRTLQAEIASKEDWESEKERYELERIGYPAFAYRLREQFVEAPAHTHHLCANCFEQRQKSILQRAGTGSRRYALVCPRCNATVSASGGLLFPIDADD